MRRWWNREVLRFVDAWACKVGTPEDEEDERNREEKGIVSRGAGESASGVVSSGGKAVDQEDEITEIGHKIEGHTYHGRNVKDSAISADIQRMMTEDV